MTFIYKVNISNSNDRWYERVRIDLHINKYIGEFRNLTVNM